MYLIITRGVPGFHTEMLCVNLNATQNCQKIYAILMRPTLFKRDRTCKFLSTAAVEKFLQ